MALVGKDAQTEFDNEYNETKTTVKKLEFVGTGLGKEEKWDGILIIDGFTAVTEVNFTDNLMDELIIINCPNLVTVDINDNEFTKVDLSEIGLNNKLKEFFANGNNLTDLNLKNCGKIKKLKLRRNPNLTKTKGLEDIKDIDDIDLTESPNIRLIHENKLSDFQQAKGVIKDLLEAGPDDKLPTSVKGSDGRIDRDKLKDAIRNKVLPIVSQKQS